jgi:hypothetical protein
MTTPTAALPRMNPERLFFGGMGLFVLVLVVAGFAPSFYLRGVAAPYVPLNPMTSLIVAHGIVFSAWVLLFISQTALITTRRVHVHRRLGLAGMGLAATMVVLGVLVAVQQAVLGRAPPGLPPLQWFAVPMFDMVVFAGLVTAGFVLRRDAQTHKRLMLLATLVMLQPAIGRFPFPTDVFYGELATVVAWAMCLPLVAWDVFSRGRIQWATAIGVTVLAAEQLIRIAVWRTDEWQMLAAWVVGALS